MKKFLKLLLVFSLVIITGCSSSVQAVERVSESNGEENIGNFTAIEKNGVIDAPQFGMKITIPKELRSDKYKWALNYVTTADQGQAILMVVDNDGNDLQEYIMNIIAFRGEVDPEDIVSDDDDVPSDIVMDLGDNGTYYYYGILIGEVYEIMPEYIEDNYMDDMDDKQKQEYIDLMKKSDQIVDNIELTDLDLPDQVQADDVDSEGLMDLVVKDFDGKEVRLGDLIAENEVTMVNFWGTFCPACVSEMPALDRLYKKYQDDGFGIVGVCVDIVNDENKVLEDNLEKGKYIIEDTGVTYPCVYAPYEVNDVYDFSAYPTTLFIDSEGNVLRDPVLGSDSESGWTKTIEKVLKNK